MYFKTNLEYFIFLKSFHKYFWLMIKVVVLVLRPQTSQIFFQREVPLSGTYINVVMEQYLMKTHIVDVKTKWSNKKIALKSTEIKGIIYSLFQNTYKTYVSNCIDLSSIITDMVTPIFPVSLFSFLGSI